MGLRLRVSPEGLEKPEIEPTTPGLEGEQLNHYATEASPVKIANPFYDLPKKVNQTSHILLR